MKNERKTCHCCKAHLIFHASGTRYCPTCDPRWGSGCQSCGNVWRNLWPTDAPHNRAATLQGAAKIPARRARTLAQQFDLAIARADYGDDE